MAPKWERKQIWPGEAPTSCGRRTVGLRVKLEDQQRFAEVLRTEQAEQSLQKDQRGSKRMYQRTSQCHVISSHHHWLSLSQGCCNHPAEVFEQAQGSLWSAHSLSNVMVSLFAKMFKFQHSKSKCKLNFTNLKNYSLKNPLQHVPSTFHTYEFLFILFCRTKVSFQKLLRALIHSLRSNSVLRFFTSVLGWFSWCFFWVRLLSEKKTQKSDDKLTEISQPFPNLRQLVSVQGMPVIASGMFVKSFGLPKHVSCTHPQRLWLPQVPNNPTDAKTLRNPPPLHWDHWDFRLRR